MSQHNDEICGCGSDDTELISSEAGVDVYYCYGCEEYFESDSFVPHTPKVRNMKDDRYNNED